jgi:hypothetical protein
MNVSGVRIELAPIVKRIAKYTKGIKKRLARMEEDKEQERYLQEYAKRKQEKKNRKEGKR